MKLKFEVKHKLTPKKPSEIAAKVYGIFGINEEILEREYVKPFELEIDENKGNIILFYGVSGTGKTTCLKQFAEQTKALFVDIRNFEDFFDNNKIIIEHFDNFEKGVELLSLCGLSEAHLFLRYPYELSEGQKYRFLLALAISKGHKFIAFDEFLATLDRTTAKVVAFNIRKLVDKYNLTIAVATTHNDIIEDLQPNYIIEFSSNGVNIHKNKIVKKKFHFSTKYTLQEVLQKIGRFSNNGIIEDTH